MRQVLTLVICICALLLGACGGSDAPRLATLESEVTEAMADLPYSHEFLKGHSTDNYVVFRMEAGASVNIAYGGRNRNGRCPKPPSLPEEHRRGAKPFAAAGPEPLICLDADDWRPGSSEAAAIARGRMVELAANALCEEVYDDASYEGFACFD